MSYDYREAVKEDVLEYIQYEIDFTEFDTLEELEKKLNEDLYNDDSVTGYASGSYTFNKWEALENIRNNHDLLDEALTDYGSGADYLINNGAEAADTIIRCYLLGECIAAAIEEIEDDFDEAHEIEISTNGFKDKLATAKEKANDHNKNIETKNNKNNDLDL